MEVSICKPKIIKTLINIQTILSDVENFYNYKNLFKDFALANSVFILHVEVINLVLPLNITRTRGDFVARGLLFECTLKIGYRDTCS